MIESGLKTLDMINGSGDERVEIGDDGMEIPANG
jgi:hypothetical protein